MGLLDYYRQFDEMTDEEVSARAARGGRRAARAARSRASSCSTSRPRPGTSARTPTSSTRDVRRARGLHTLPDRPPTSCAASSATATASTEQRVAVGNGAAQLLSAPRRCCWATRRRALTPWPSYRLYPRDGAARRAPRRAGRRATTSSGCARRSTPRTRVDRALQPERPDRRATSASPSCASCSTRCPSTSRCCSTRRSSTS